MRLKKFIPPLLACALFLLPVFSFAQTETAGSGRQPSKPNLYAQNFFVPSGQKLDQKVTEIRGFSFIKTHSRSQNAEYSIITDFGGGALKTRYLPGLKDPQAIDNYIKEKLLVAVFEGVEVRKLPVPSQDGKTMDLFWVGDKAFSTSQEATAEVGRIKKLTETHGGNFRESVSEVPVFIEPEPEPVQPVKTAAQFKKEEELVLKFTDQMSIGEKLFGPFQGEPSGEPILWQSFGETSWRKTDLAKRNFDSETGYWTNRFVFKGIRFPLDTVNPYFEATGSMDSTSTTWTNNLKLWAGLEWRPLQRNAWLYNFRPFGWDLPLLEWVRNYRVYIQYGNRYNLKNDIPNSKDYDLVWGVQCYYQWGFELPALDEGKPTAFADYLRKYFWGEYYGNYYVTKTNFSSFKSFNALIANTSLYMGIKLPGIPLPQNPINDELVLVPFVHLDHVSNSSFSSWYENQFFVGTGIAWMPFRSYRWKEDEWLSKTWVFGEWIGLGRAQRTKENPPDGVPNYDLRFGVKFSHRRF